MNSATVAAYLGCLIRTYQSLGATGLPPPLQAHAAPNGQAAVKVRAPCCCAVQVVGEAAGQARARGGAARAACGPCADPLATPARPCSRNPSTQHPLSPLLPQVYPLTLGERLFPLTAGLTCELVLEPGVAAPRQGSLLRQHEGRVEVVLGAGNQVGRPGRAGRGGGGALRAAALPHWAGGGGQRRAEAGRCAAPSALAAIAAALPTPRRPSPARAPTAHRAAAPPPPPLSPPTSQGFLGMKDILCALFEWNAVVLFKPHPQLAAFHAIMERALEPLAAGGYYRSVGCDLELTRHLLYHPAVRCALWGCWGLGLGTGGGGWG